MQPQQLLKANSLLARSPDLPHAYQKLGGANNTAYAGTHGYVTTICDVATGSRARQCFRCAYRTFLRVSPQLMELTHQPVGDATMEVCFARVALPKLLKPVRYIATEFWRSVQWPIDSRYST